MKTIPKIITLLLLLSGSTSATNESKNVVRVDLEYRTYHSSGMENRIDLQTLDDSKFLQIDSTNKHLL